ncbi:Pre-mRNA-splicing factor dre4 [Daldinia childiae]|uniref:Pre-mRNA-splicing factor dre4 n=1 Tax=Daldinia childiae TaxID=326645 RepID=UPI001446DBA2|nr:Pre-mRNA-splicing factor dre4 [Daldinia childiae]KAF3068363.1 Pre-mRNA-splicing factor dre4 [Daldinia childiae]
MLKSTYKPSSNQPPRPPPLPPGWTEHKAPTGHTFYHNAATKESTYTRPGASPLPTTTSIFQSSPPPQNPHANFLQYSTVPQLSDPATANAFLAQYDPAHQRNAQQHGGRGGHRGHHEGKDRPRPQPADKPKSKVAIPGCEPWLLVYTKYGRRFAYNPTKNASYWRIPEKVMKGVLELDIRGIKEKATGTQGEGADVKTSATPSTEPQIGTLTIDTVEETEEQVEIGSDYEEVEVTDDEGEEEKTDEAVEDEDKDNERPPKRQRTEDPTADIPVEFNEDDIAYQLQAMGDEYGLDPGEYDDGNPDAWPEGAEGLPLSETDAIELFKDLLNDYGINPYSSWEKLIEEGRIIEDGRYTVLNTMKARKDAWEEWSRERIQILKEQRAKEEKKDPRIPYLAFLQQKATPKLYWPEFRRKYKKEAPMRDTNLNDRDREKWYREHINRLKLPQDSLKKDLATLLRSIPLRALNNKTHLENLPAQILADLRYISLDPQIRDPLIEAYVQTLGQPPADDGAGDDGEAARKAKEERKKREKALEERERIVAEEKRKQKRQLEYGKAALREEERELERAMHVGKKGLQSQLLAANKTDNVAG